MDRSPPPFFNQGPSARARMIFFAFIACVLLIVDARLHSLELIRRGIGTVLYPLQKMALWPRDAAVNISDYFVSVNALQKENEQLRRQTTQLAEHALATQGLRSENNQLRQLLQARAAQSVSSVLAEIAYDARDPFTRKVVLDRGTQHGVQPGQPVIDDQGVLGQITRAFPFSAEMTLLTDREQAIPVQILRTGARSVAYGLPESGQLELRFLSSNADVQNGDMLVTSGIDGIYPAGLPVAKVVNVERKAGSAFAQITCMPAAGVNQYRHVLVLLVKNDLPPPLPDQNTHKTQTSRQANAAHSPKKNSESAHP